MIADDYLTHVQNCQIIIRIKIFTNFYICLLYTSRAIIISILEKPDHFVLIQIHLTDITLIILIPGIEGAVLTACSHHPQPPSDL